MTSSAVAEKYDRAYFEQLVSSKPSAQAVLPLVFGLVRPVSLVDVGGGTGAWASVSLAAGIDTIVIDSELVPSDQLLVPSERFVVRDLAAPFTLERTFDIALCLEVAEHLPVERATSFVNDLCTLAPVVLFSAAIPGQGGRNHLNEQWQSYWVGLFNEEGFTAYDAVRPHVWRDERVQKWYRQNTVLYSREPLPVGPQTLWDVVHPDLFASANAILAAPRVRPALRFLRRALVARMHTTQRQNPSP